MHKVRGKHRDLFLDMKMMGEGKAPSQELISENIPPKKVKEIKPKKVSQTAAAVRPQFSMQFTHHSPEAHRKWLNTSPEIRDSIFLYILRKIGHL